MEVLIEQVNEVLHYGFNFIGIFLNSVLGCVIITSTPQPLRAYAVLLFNFTINDLLSCFSALFVMQRIIPCGTSLMYISYGYCTNFGPNACYVGYAFMLHYYAHALYSMPLSFAYRYCILIRPAPRALTVAAACFVVYLPSLFQALTFMGASSAPSDVRVLMHQCFPEYNLTGATVTGHLTIFDTWTLFTILYMTLPCGPVYALILYFRKKVYNALETSDMSEKTKNTHKQLIKALTLQACLPLLFTLAVISYGTEQLNLYHHPLLEHFVFQVLGLIPVLSPGLSLFFVAPYRRAILKFLLKMHIRPGKYAVEPTNTLTHSNISSVNKIA